MSVEHEAEVRALGTKVRLFAQAPFVAGYDEPEIVWLSPPAGTVKAGPADDRMYVVDPVDKTEPYQFPYLPPYYGPVHPPVLPEVDGHFDHFDPGSREFSAAHLYGSVRRVLYIAESYLGRRIEWHFGVDYPRMELIPLIDWDNAQSGYGFVEMGYGRDEKGTLLPYTLNFDVIAHEVGHLVLFGLSGVPPVETRTQEFYGFHEGISDLTAHISMLHFDTAMDRLLRGTKGNLYTLNELNRIAELSDNRQIRLASTAAKMSDVVDATDPHDLSRPLTGAIFDMLVEVYQANLRERDLIDADLERASSRATGGTLADRVQAGFAAAYANRHFGFKSALADARDTVAGLLMATLEQQPVENLSYAGFAHRFCGLADATASGKYRAVADGCFAWREII